MCPKSDESGDKPDAFAHGRTSDDPGGHGAVRAAGGRARRSNRSAKRPRRGGDRQHRGRPARGDGRGVGPDASRRPEPGRHRRGTEPSPCRSRQAPTVSRSRCRASSGWSARSSWPMRPPRPSTSALERGGLFEEVTVAVTGTAIEAPAINMPHAVTVVSRDTLEQQGSTQLVDLFRNLSVSHGVVGERNSWYNSNQPATLTENVARRDSALGQRRAGLRRLHARPQGPPSQDVADLPLRRAIRVARNPVEGGGGAGLKLCGERGPVHQPPRSQGRGRVLPHASRGHSL